MWAAGPHMFENSTVPAEKRETAPTTSPVLGYAILGAIPALGVRSPFRPARFSYGMFVVNVAGSLLAGVLIARFEVHALESHAARAFVFVGVLGGFTTFSALASDTFSLARSSPPLLAALKSGGQVVVGLIAL